MNWAEHEKEYCVEVFVKPIVSMEFEYNDYVNTCTCQYFYEIDNETSYKVVKFESKYYVIIDLD